jgi:hypothetical protein
MYMERLETSSLNIDPVINSGCIYLRFGRDGGNEGSL